MGKTVVKFYGDGEFWIDGQKRAKLYSNGAIWADGKKIGQLYENGEIWIDDRKVGSCTEDGDIWIDGKRVATGVHLLSVFEQEENSSSGSSYEKSYSDGGNGKGLVELTDFVKNLSGISGGNIILGGIVVLIICSIIASVLLWIKGMPDIYAENMNHPAIGVIAQISAYIFMLIIIYKHWDIITREGISNIIDFFGAFLRGLVTQGLVCFAHFLVFYILDVVITAFSYGISLFEILANLGDLFSGVLLAGLLSTIFFGLAPALISTLSALLYLLFKGRRQDAPPSKLTFQNVIGFFTKRKNKNTNKARTAKNIFGDVNTSNTAHNSTSNPSHKQIHQCTCGCKLRFPTDQGEYTFTCPKCNKRYTYKPSK